LYTVIADAELCVRWILEGTAMAELDYALWVERAVAFNERLRRLPGEITVKTDVEPPLEQAQVEGLSKKLRHPIPAPIKRFLATASANCRCECYWDPPADYQERIGNLFGTRSKIQQLAADIPALWHAASTTAKDRKEIIRHHDSTGYR
jgi:hypothetical protein